MKGRGLGPRILGVMWLKNKSFPCMGSCCCIVYSLLHTPPVGSLSVAAAPPVPAWAGPQTHCTSVQMEPRGPVGAGPGSHVFRWQALLHPCVRSHRLMTGAVLYRSCPTAHTGAQEGSNQRKRTAVLWVGHLDAQTERCLEPDSKWKTAKPPTFLTGTCLWLGEEVPGATLNWAGRGWQGDFLLGVLEVTGFEAETYHYFKLYIL